MFNLLLGAALVLALVALGFSFFTFALVGAVSDQVRELESKGLQTTVTVTGFAEEQPDDDVWGDI